MDSTFLNALRLSIADRSGTDGRGAGQRARDRRQQRRWIWVRCRPRCSASMRMRRGTHSDARRHEPAVQRELLLPHGAGCDAAREAAWRGELAQYYREFAIDPNSIPEGAAAVRSMRRWPTCLASSRRRSSASISGCRRADLVARVKQWGATILSSATTVDEARWLEDHGVDVVIAQGVEAGGHRGMFLIDRHHHADRYVRAVAADRARGEGAGDCGGRHRRCERRRGGACARRRGVQIGSAYLLCPEATTSAVHRAALKSDAARHTALTNVFTGRPARGIVNRMIRELGPMCRIGARVSVGAVRRLRRCAQKPKREAAATSRRCGAGRTRPVAKRFRRPS